MIEILQWTELQNELKLGYPPQSGPPTSYNWVYNSYN